jgi:hypothetical protein
MFKRLLVFSLAFCLSLILLQFLKPHYETCPVRVVTNPTISNDSRPIQSDRQISVSHNSSFKDLIQKFQNALAQDDKETIISLIKFPVNM